MAAETSRHQRSAEGSPYRTAIILFVAIFCIYLINPDPVWSGDMNSNSIFAFNLFEFHTIYLDGFSQSHLAKSFNWLGFLRSSPGNWSAGRWVSSFPVGASVVTLPVYAFFYLYMKLFA